MDRICSKNSFSPFSGRFILCSERGWSDVEARVLPLLWAYQQLSRHLVALCGHFPVTTTTTTTITPGDPFTMHWTLLFSLVIVLLWGSESFPSVSCPPVSFSLLTSLAARNPFDWSLHSNLNSMNMDNGLSQPAILRVQYCGG